jgi:hypothetical protein
MGRSYNVRTVGIGVFDGGVGGARRVSSARIYAPKAHSLRGGGEAPQEAGLLDSGYREREHC